MDRRNFVTAALAGVGVSSVVRANDFIFPRKLEGQGLHPKPFLEGLTDEEMAALIGQLPQGKGVTTLIWTHAPAKRAVIGIEFYEHLSVDTVSSWVIEGTTIHVIDKFPVFTVDFDGNSIQTGWDYRGLANLDVKSLNLIRLVYSSPEYKRMEYRRKETASGAGWFTLLP